jgi:hypothetical protein
MNPRVQQLYQASWMATRGDVDLLDKRVRQLLSRVTPAGVQSVSVLATDLHHLIDLGDESLAFVGTAVCSLLAELLLGAETAGIFPNELHNPEDRSEAVLWNALRSLRNTCFHPAAMAPPAHVDLLVEHLRHRDAMLAERLRKDRSELRSPRMLLMAIRLVDELGRTQLRHWRR